MLEIKKKARHPILTMVSANLDSWIHTPRTIIMLIFTLMLCYLEVKTQVKILDRAGIVMYWYEIPYVLMSSGINISMSSILFFVMVSEMPRKLPYQNYMLIRSNRRQWLTSQIVYSISIALLVILLLVICVMIFSTGQAGAGTGWSDTARIAEGSMMEFDAVVPRYVREHFAPAFAILYAALPVFLFWFSMAMVILLCTLLGSQFIGLLVCAFALLGHFVGSYNFAYPINYAIVQNMNPDIFGPERYQWTMGAYLIINALMILGMYVRIAKSDLVFYAENKL